MLAESIEFRGFDAVRWVRLARLLGARRRRTLPVGPPGVLLLKRGDRLVKALHTHRGRVPVGEVPETELRAVARALRARWVLSADLDAVEAAVEAASRAFSVGGDVLELALAVGEAADAERQAGRIELWPDLLEGVKPPSREAVEKVFDILLPPRTSALAYLFDGEDLAAEIVLARGPRELELIGGHQALEAGPPPRRWRDDYRRLLHAAERRIGAPSLGVFASFETAKAILSGRDDLSLALARRDVIIDPFPVWLAGPLGAVAVKNVVDAGRRAREQLAEKVKPKGLAGRLAGKVAGKVAGRVKRGLEERLEQAEQLGDVLRAAGAFDRVEQTVGKLRKRADLAEILGFDPIAVGKRFAALSKGDGD